MSCKRSYQLKTPNIFDYTEAKFFFRDFYENRRELGPAHSFRAVAKRLQWPPSYLNDLIHDRKKLTVRRAIEFANFFKWDSLKSERLVYMALQESSDPSVASFFIKTFENEQNTSSMSVPLLPRTEQTKIETAPAAVYTNLAVMAVLETIRWAKGRVTENDLIKLLPSVPEIRDPKVLNSTLQVLIDNSCISRADQGFEVLKGALTYSPQADEKPYPMQLWLEHAGRLREIKTGGTSFSGLISIRRDRHQEALQRIMILKNWFIAMDKECSSIDFEKRTDSLVFQINVQLFSLFKLKLFNLSPLNQEVDLGEQIPDESWMELD